MKTRLLKAYRQQAGQWHRVIVRHGGAIMDVAEGSPAVLVYIIGTWCRDRGGMQGIESMHIELVHSS